MTTKKVVKVLKSVECVRNESDDETPGLSEFEADEYSASAIAEFIAERDREFALAAFRSVLDKMSAYDLLTMIRDL